MANLMPSDIKDDRPYYLTAYQILDRLPNDIRTRLIQERTIGGRGAGVSYGAPSVVSDAAELLKPDIEIDYIDNVGMHVDVAGTPITPGFEVCGIYRLRA